MALSFYLMHLLVLFGPIWAITAQLVPLRLMPLGDSITRGYLSSDDNGYREDLFNDLQGVGYTVDMVGSQQAGNMKDPDNDGFNGYKIDDIAGEARTDVPVYNPNLIVLNAGTNDCLQSFDIDTAGSRLYNLITQLFQMVPDVTIILSTLTMNADGPTDQRVQDVNIQVRNLASTLIGQGERVVLAETHGPDGPQVGDLADGTHPNDVGYNKMASIYFNAIKSASAQGFIQP
ncbi:SGNH hydrolase-type esterase domain-containing protein [Xylaria castorea]|nr:SGNH hydrolase-type esterase domain-containing protein [Xylaria castorea]